MAWVQINRDPFARQDLVRRVTAAHGGCDWCGQWNGQRGLYEYGLRPDSISGRVNPVRGKFCSVSCMRSYHE